MQCPISEILATCLYVIYIIQDLPKKEANMLSPSSLADQAWSMISSYLSHGNYGTRAKYAKRLWVDAIVYITTPGCQWRHLPNHFPPWQAVYNFFRRANQSLQQPQKHALLSSISKPIKTGWTVLAKRWSVERTLLWCNLCQRRSKGLSNDYPIARSMCDDGTLGVITKKIEIIS